MVIDVEIQSIVYTSTLGNCGVITRIKYGPSSAHTHIYRLDFFSFLFVSEKSIVSAGDKEHIAPAHEKKRS